MKDRMKIDLPKVLLPALLLFAAPTFAAAPARPAAESGPRTFAKATAGLEKRAGLLTVWVDRRRGRSGWRCPPPPARAARWAATSIRRGSSPAWARTRWGSTAASSATPGSSPCAGWAGACWWSSRTSGSAPCPRTRRSGRRCASRSPPRSSGPARSPPRTPDGRALVDFTPFLVRDAHDIVARLKRHRAGELVARRRRAAWSISRTAWPSRRTWSSSRCSPTSRPSRGALVRETAPTAGAMTLVQHHSLVRLPDAGYKPRAFDPRAG